MKWKVVYLALPTLALFTLLAYLRLGEVTENVVVREASYTIPSGAFEATAVTAPTYVVFDVASGDILAAREPETLHEMASVVKLLTADTALAVADIEASTTVSWRALAAEGRSGKLGYGEEYRMRELLFPLLLESSNDAAEVIAETYGREDFIEAMRGRAREIGMASTTIVDPSGLSPKNQTTASDLTLMLAHLYHIHRHVLDITSLTTYIGRTHTWRNNDPVITSAGFIGGKHGYTDTAGRTLAAVFETRFGDDRIRPIGIILLGSEDLVADVAALRQTINERVAFGVSPL